MSEKDPPIETMEDDDEWEDQDEGQEGMAIEVADSGDEKIEEDDDDNDEEKDDAEDGGVYLPSRRPLREDEQLMMDESAYRVFYQLNVESSSLSFDVLHDNLGDDRGDTVPLSAYLVAGTQAPLSHINKLVVMRLSNLHPIKHKEKKSEEEPDASSDEEEEEEDLENKPEVDSASIRHNGTVNRVRSKDYSGRYLAASWSEMGQVYIWDLTRPLSAVNDSAVMTEYTRKEESPEPIFAFRGHSMEGFALDWSPHQHRQGWLASGDCRGALHIWEPTSAGTWQVGAHSLVGHTASVEDIQWSPTEPSVLCTCSVDRTIRVWDVRAKPERACQIRVPDAHPADVNVLAWNRKNSKVMVSGGDDGSLRVWDLRWVKDKANSWTQGQAPLYTNIYQYHKGAITSVEWHPTEESIFCASGEDDQVTLWDTEMEEAERNVSGSDVVDVPVHLLFVHMGQKEVKEVHWHPQIPGLLFSTALDGINAFRPINV